MSAAMAGAHLTLILEPLGAKELISAAGDRKGERVGGA